MWMLNVPDQWKLEKERELVEHLLPSSIEILHKKYNSGEITHHCYRFLSNKFVLNLPSCINTDKAEFGL